MAQVFAPFPVIGTFKCGITFYMDRGRNLARKKSSLTGRRVKTSPEFAHTRAHAGILTQASRIASVIYDGLPAYFKKFWMFRSFTGEAMQLLKAGKTREEAIAELWRVYVAEHEARGVAQETKKAPKRKYTKTAKSYWENKTAKANKRKAQKEKLQYYAGLLAKASKIGSAVYKSLPEKERQYWKYKVFTGIAIRMLKEGMEEEEALEFLVNESCLTDRLVGGLKSACPADRPAYRTGRSTGAEVKKTESRETENKPVNYIPILKLDSIVCIPQVRSSPVKRGIVKRRPGRFRLSIPP